MLGGGGEGGGGVGEWLAEADKEGPFSNQNERRKVFLITKRSHFSNEFLFKK